MSNLQIHPDWITDRLPTPADADKDGDVICPGTNVKVTDGPMNVYCDKKYVHYSQIVFGQPWWSKKAAANPTPAPPPPAPTPTRKVVQIATMTEGKNINAALFVLCSDDSIFVAIIKPNKLCQWEQLPPIPQPE